MAIYQEYLDPRTDPMVFQFTRAPVRKPPPANSASARTDFFAKRSVLLGSRNSTYTLTPVDT